MPNARKLPSAVSYDTTGGALYGNVSGNPGKGGPEGIIHCDFLGNHFIPDSCGCLGQQLLVFQDKAQFAKQEKMRRQSLWALLALTVICIGLGVFVCVGTANTVLEIRKDIEDNTYITYEGSYSVGSGYHARGVQYDRWLTVDFDYDDYALLYMNSFFEWLATEEGYFEGRIVYGKNSLIVVEIDSE